MALLHVNFYSDLLELACSMDVILPETVSPRPDGKWPALYLLHGLSDDHTIWQRRTSIERHVAGRNLAVVMPTVQRGFYTDMRHGAPYWTFISEELPALCERLFPIAPERGARFAAGLSMGGYGAFKLGLRRPDRYARSPACLAWWTSCSRLKRCTGTATPFTPTSSAPWKRCAEATTICAPSQAV